MSSCRMLEVMATMGICGATIRIMAVADTPSRFGMMMSMKMRSKRSASRLTFSTASRPSRAVSTTPSMLVRNFDPILAHVLSSSTSRMWGFFPRHIEPPCSLSGGVTCDGASAWMLGLLSGRLYGMLWMWSAWNGSMPVV